MIWTDLDPVHNTHVSCNQLGEVHNEEPSKSQLNHVSMSGRCAHKHIGLEIASFGLCPRRDQWRFISYTSRLKSNAAYSTNVSNREKHLAYINSEQGKPIPRHF